jgi:hypothetical protein
MAATIQKENLGQFLDYFENSHIPRELVSEVFLVISEFSKLAHKLRAAPVEPVDSLRDVHGIDEPGGWDLDILVTLILMRSNRRLRESWIVPRMLYTVEDLVHTLSDLTVSTEGDTLLRPADPPTSDQSLLRPAVSSPEQYLGNLLKPSTANRAK